MTQVNVQRGDRVLIVVQDRALIKQNLRPTVGRWPTSGENNNVWKATVKAKALYSTAGRMGVENASCYKPHMSPTTQNGCLATPSTLQPYPPP
jgi:hypothetical protein